MLDVNLPGITGLDFLSQIRSDSEASKTEAPHVIIITAHGSERLAVQAVKSGAYDYLSKPFEVDDLRLVVKNAFENIELRRENRSLRRRIEIETSQRGALLGNSEAMQRVRAMIESAGATLLYLPPYSPDLNPIELAFAKLKQLLRSAGHRTMTALWQDVQRMLDLISADNAANFLRHCGYVLQPE